MLFYSFINWNYQIWLIFVVITLVQLPIKKCESYIYFVNNYVNPLLYFQKFERIFEEPVPEDQPCMFSFHPHSVFAYGIFLLI